MLAYVLIVVEHGKEDEVFNSAMQIKEATGGHILFGEWDIIIKFNVKNSERLAVITMDELRQLKGVRMTSSLIVAK